VQYLFLKDIQAILINRDTMTITKTELKKIIKEEISTKIFDDLDIALENVALILHEMLARDVGKNVYTPGAASNYAAEQITDLIKEVSKGNNFKIKVKNLLK